MDFELEMRVLTLDMGVVEWCGRELEIKAREFDPELIIAIARVRRPRKSYQCPGLEDMVIRVRHRVGTRQGYGSAAHLRPAILQGIKDGTKRSSRIDEIGRAHV